MKLIRTCKPKRAVKFTSILAWYEGIVYYRIEYDDYVIAILPLNIFLRLIRSFYYWVKIGVWLTGREKAKFVDNRDL